ncbi:adenine deaminase C-terminal domain-containing protein [Desulfobacula sp.]|uniref:adenine deaminase C-terminal domain-containing protein n=1 Tax=Desulfobacula sp. TaxID=2593537 RepID=UPI00262270F3|nr:adenine deaminase C-terminal domain-containing protein [Desulfobacula sp.]
MKRKLLCNKDQKALMDVAVGIQPADLVVSNCRMLNVYTGEIIADHAICIKDKWIACITRDADSRTGPDTQIIDARGMTVIPGLIDGHTHLGNYFSASEFLTYAMAGGTTCLVTEALETAFPITGIDGIMDFMDSYQDQPIKVFATAPMVVSPSKNVGRISAAEMAVLLNRDDVLGLGEVYWQSVFHEPDAVLPFMNQALALGKTVEGHSAGAKGGKLAAYVGTGVSSCHEPIDMAQTLERLRMGLYVMVREGGIRADLETISPLKDEGVDLRRLILVTDSVSPEFLLEKGTMEYVAQKAIDLGFNPVDVVRMVTLNVAEHFGMDHMVGGIAPGRFADLCIIPDIRHIAPLWVISNGRVVAREGKCVVSPRVHGYSKKSLNTVNLEKIFSAEDFMISAPPGLEQVDVRIIEKLTPLVTRETIRSMPVVDGRIPADIETDTIKIAALDRVTGSNNCFTGLVSGVGMTQGAIASSGSWDTRDITVMGADETDMALAVNRITELQGGAVVTARGRVVAELPMPIMGLMSDLPVEKVAQKTNQVNQAAKDLGCIFEDPLLSLVTSTSTAIPYLRICELGLFNLKDGKTRGLFVRGDGMAHNNE